MSDLNHQQMVDELLSTGNYKIATRLTNKVQYSKERPTGPVMIGTILDTETTGLSPIDQEIVNISLVSFECDREGNIYRLIGKCNEFREPNVPVTEESRKIHRITDEELQGKKVNRDRIATMIKRSDFIVAHNAQFDRSFFDRLFPEFSSGLMWCCSQRQIPWKDLGIDSEKQKYIALELGFFYEEHKAESDCLACLEILSRTIDGKKLLSYMIDSFDVDHYIIKPNQKFVQNDLVKAKKYVYNNVSKDWSKFVLGDEAMNEEKDYLDSVGINGYDIKLIPRLDLFKE